MRRLLATLERHVRDLKQKFPPPPSPPPDSVEGLEDDLRLACILIVHFHHHGSTSPSDRLREVVQSIGVPEFFNSDWNNPVVADAVCRQFWERTWVALRTLVEMRGGRWCNDKPKASLSHELAPLYAEIPVNLKDKYLLPAEFAEFSRRDAALFGDEPPP